MIKISLKDIIQWLNRRYATKKFDDKKKIDIQTIDDILECLILSPSSYWIQPYKFILIEDKNIKQQLLSLSYHQLQVVDCSHIILFCTIKNLDENYIDKYLNILSQNSLKKVQDFEGYKKMILWTIDYHTKNWYIETWKEKQVYISLWILMSICALNWIDACPMEWFDRQQIDKLLNLEKFWLNSSVMCPIWYRHQDDEYSKKTKTRFQKSDLIINL